MENAMSMPRGEYPRPQFARDDWLCLNGPWQFEIDAGDSGLERGLTRRDLAGRITVPFCPESPLSGIGNTDFLNAVWYRRDVEIPRAWSGRRVLLHFQAADYDATVWVNGVEVARHRGGWTPFTADLGGVAEPGRAAVIVVRARDDHRRPKPQGKQCPAYANHGCLYTRTTGIWQTVWLEPVPRACRLLRPRITPDAAGGRFLLTQPITNRRPGTGLRAVLSDAEGEVAAAECAADADFAPRLGLAIPRARRRAWCPEDPHLYDLVIELIGDDGHVIDRARSYAGLRGLTIDGMAVKLNGRAVFQRLVLDQGYYPDGILTAPSDAALRRDIELAMRAGFNGARLHQKVFEERFLYHADRLGYLLWGESGDWSPDPAESRRQPTFITQWLEVLRRDYSHPAIVGWCPLNETYDAGGDAISNHDDLVRGLFLATKAADATRPVLDASGHTHRVAEADVYDCHDYCQDAEQFRRHHADTGAGEVFANEGDASRSVPYRGQPFFVSEFGGIWWNEQEAAASADGGDRSRSWGYGRRPRDVEEFHRRFEALCGALLDDPAMFGYCYTQLTDVYQEQNGIYAFDRSAKLDVARIRAAQARPAAIERESR
jgi:beta-galactosidase/beta-glucuronidase